MALSLRARWHEARTACGSRCDDHQLRRRRRQHQALPRALVLMPTGLMAAAAPALPAMADLGRMQRDRSERLRAGMAAQGIDALVLLGNTNVVYATGVVSPAGSTVM